jgi:hypothetical protein
MAGGDWITGEPLLLLSEIWILIVVDLCCVKVDEER